MTIVFFYRGDLCEHINYMFYTKRELLRLAKRYGIENDYNLISIPDFEMVLERHGDRWYK